MLDVWLRAKSRMRLRQVRDLTSGAACDPKPIVSTFACHIETSKVYLRIFILAGPSLKFGLHSVQKLPNAAHTTERTDAASTCEQGGGVSLQSVLRSRLHLSEKLHSVALCRRGQAPTVTLHPRLLLSGLLVRHALAPMMAPSPPPQVAAVTFLAPWPAGVARRAAVIGGTTPRRPPPSLPRSSFLHAWRLGVAASSGARALPPSRGASFVVEHPCPSAPVAAAAAPSPAPGTPAGPTTRVVVSVDIPAPLPAVAASFRDLSRMPAWSACLTSVVRDPTDPSVTTWSFSWRGVKLSWQAVDAPGTVVPPERGPAEAGGALSAAAAVDDAAEETEDDGRPIVWTATTGVRHVGEVTFADVTTSGMQGGAGAGVVTTRLTMVVDAQLGGILAAVVSSTSAGSWIEGAIAADLARFRAYVLRSQRRRRLARAAAARGGMASS